MGDAVLMSPLTMKSVQHGNINCIASYKMYVVTLKANDELMTRCSMTIGGSQGITGDVVLISYRYIDICRSLECHW